MSGLELFADGAIAFLRWDVMLAILAGMSLGLFFGLLPGIGGVTALALLLPLVQGMDPMPGLAFLLSVHAVIYNGGSVTAVLFGVPGAPPSAATLIDGQPLARQGRAAYAIAAALSASAIGGVIGALALGLLLPVLKPVVFLLGSPETFLLALAGVACLAILGKGSMTKGLIAGGLGLCLAMVGYQQTTGVPRFWFGSDYLLDGLRVLPVITGLFAVPELVRLALAGQAIESAPTDGSLPARQIVDGIIAPVRHWALTLRSSLLGVLVGIIPGIGGEAASFIAYGTAKHSAANAAEYGQGAIEGVIAPEAANNAKEGGSLVPTLALGIPGSSGMVLLLGAFQLLGLEPGARFLKIHMDLAVGLTLTLAAANLVSAVAMLALARPLVLVSALPGRVLAPVLLAIVLLGVYAVDASFADVGLAFLFGGVGLIMQGLGYARAALVLGFVLGRLIETYFSISMQAYGAGFLLRPITLAIGLLLLAGMFWRPAVQMLVRRR
jgi:TctA family transporter